MSSATEHAPRSVTHTPLWARSAHELSSMLARREVSSREIVQALLDRIDAVDGSVRAFVRVYRDAALAAADEADRARARGEVRSALHGLPVTVKECFDVAGEATTLGLPSRATHRAERDAAMITLLRDAGAIVLGRTNLSQTMLFPESRNPVFGQTANPFSLSHTPGGSSGGEAAAIASGSSVLGVGTDIGGSIRVPSAFCGIVGIKPTLDRLPMRGYSSVVPGQEVVRGQCGPMARTVADLTLFFSALSPEAMSAIDGRVPPIAFGDPSAISLERRRVGFYVNDEVTRPSQSVARAVERACETLRAAGCEVVPFTPPGIPDAIYLQLEAMSADRGTTLRAALAGGEIDPVLKPLVMLARVPGQGRRALAMIADGIGDRPLARLLRSLGEKRVRGLWDVTAQLRAWRHRVLDAARDARVDAWLCPPFATPPPEHVGMRGFTLALSYAMAWNAAQLPAGVVPIGRVREDETARSPAPGQTEKLAAAVDARSAGLPLAVQVVAPPWQESLVLALMSAIERGVRDDAERPRTPVDPRG